ncbi:hypothetical protein [Streptomyces sp. NPDC055287]
MPLPDAELIEVTPGVKLLVSIGTWQPEFLLTGEVLRDQGRLVTGLVEAGWRREHLRQVIAGRPLPVPVRTSVGAIVAARLRQAAAGPVPNPNVGLGSGIPLQGGSSQYQSAPGPSTTSACLLAGLVS